jgi:hypothetical protein
MNSRERVLLALNHQVPDRIPVDWGGTVVTSIHASAIAKLRTFLGLKNKPVKVFEPMMMLGKIEDDMLDLIKTDVIGLYSPHTLLGYKNENWKPWRLPDGTEVLMGGGFEYSCDKDGATYAYPKGNRKAPPSAKMPKNGLYFDNITRQDDLSNHDFNARKDYKDQYSVFSEEDCKYYEETSRILYEQTEYAIFGNFFVSGVGDIFHIPGAWLEYPKGIRDISDWYIAHCEHPDYIKEFFDMQKEIQLKNLELYRQAVGERIVAIAITGTDFGTQNGPLISLDLYRKFYKPYHKIFNEWVHKNTKWKVFIHTCGSVVEFIDDFIDAGFDILNPVQFSAYKMGLSFLKEKYGSSLVFWGGGVNPQKTLAFGNPEEIKAEVKNNMKILSAGGGFVCASVHNIQGPTPPENIAAFFESVNS